MERNESALTSHHRLGRLTFRPDPGPGHRVHGYPTLHIADASVVPANLGLTPSLTITAMAERAFTAWDAA